MYAQNDVKDDFPSTKAEKGGGHTILFFCRQFMSVRVSEESLAQARIRCLAFWIVSLEQENWVLPNSTDKFGRGIVSSMGTTTQHRTWGRKPRFAGVIRKHSYEECGVEWDEKVASEEEIKGIEVREAWKPSNKSSTSNLLYGICIMKVATHGNWKMCWCTMVHEPHVLVRSGQSSLQYAGMYYGKQEKHSPDIFLIQETHLRPSHNFNIANYTCYRNNRISDGPRTAGGTLILVKNCLKYYCLPTPPLRALEATNIILTPPKQDPISITCVYIPPSSDENLFTIDIEHFIQTASNCILFGDFNATHNAWNSKNNTTRGRHLFNFANRLNLNIAFPSTLTRFGHNSANTIDIALIKIFYYPFTINSIDDLSSDHNPVFLNFNFKLAEEPPNPRALSTDWKVFKTNPNKNLSLFDFHPNSINNTNDLEQKITEFIERVIGTHRHASRPIETDRRNFTPHHNNQLLKIKNYFRKRYHQTLNPIFKSHYNRAQSDLKKELKKYNDNIWQKRLEALNTADNSLWRTQRFFKNKRPKIPPLNCTTGTAVTDHQKANLLATNIKNNFVENDREDDNYNQNDALINTTVNNFLSTPPNSFIEPALPDEIIHYIKHVNAKKAPGKDSITNRIYWKEAIIFPINKPGKDPHLGSSYRPISLLSTIGKLTESIILHRLKNDINENNVLNPNQYGFTNKFSTLHPLLKLTENISEGFQKNCSRAFLFLDNQKAFDRVWINGLTFKLITFKIPPPLIHLIHSYLTNRSFRIRINETLSNEHSVSAGCPQDSLLGPLLFNLYINDIPDYSLTKINLYADDTAIHATYKKLETISFALNKHLLHLQNFFDKWKISINVEKSTAIIFTKKQSLPPPIIMYNKQIPWSQEAKYLGIIFDTHLTWKQHIYYVRDKFRKIMFKLYPLIGRNSYLSIENKVLLYTAVMRPILAYACPVWGYAAKTNINILDTLQNSLIRMIVKATRYMRNDDIRNALKINSFKSHIQNIAINFFNDLEATNNINMQSLSHYTPNDKTKRPRRILLDSYNPP
ncbi:probable RNA-directed DNA polymerase from transposon X-element [Trichonephila clavipes]|nr:probable RNA-directed DNA polymerase from transposon X-element [Trichonephila clavipes]